MALVPDKCAKAITYLDGRLQKVCGKAEFIELFHNLIVYAEALAIMVASVAVLYGGFLVLTSAGDSGRVTQGRQAITKAVVGMAIVFGAYVIVNTIISIFLPDCKGEWTTIGGGFDCK